MNKMKMVLMLSLLAALILSACGGGEPSPTPTLSPDEIQTLAVVTFQAQLTQTALAMPTATPRPTNTPLPLVTFVSPTTSSVGIPTNTTVAGGVGASTCYGLSYVSDVTIPDNTQVTPGQTFTKTWRVLNSGSCAWEPGFVFKLVGGDPIGGTAVTLNQRVESGAQYDISVPMVVPTNKSGELRGTWRLSDANGNLFGDGVYVLVQVGGSAPTSTGVATTPTPTATSETQQP